MLGLVQTLAVGSSLVLALAPMPEVLEMATSKSTEHRSFWPYFAMWQCALLWILYGLLTGQLWPIGCTNLFTCVMSSYYCFTYFHATASPLAKRQIRAAFVAATVLTSGLAACCNLHAWLELSKEDMVQHVGCIGSVASVAMFAVPLTAVPEVIKTKSSRSLSLNLAAGGNLCAALWCLYGYMVGDAFVELTNLIGGLCCMAQLLLYFYFPDTSHKLSSKANI